MRAGTARIGSVVSTPGNRPSSRAHCAGARLGEAHRHVLRLRLQEIDIGDAIDGVHPHQRADHHRHRHADAETGHRRAQRPAADLPQQDARRLIERGEEATASEQRAPEQWRRGRPHGLGRRQLRDPAHRAECAEQTGDEARQRGGEKRRHTG